MGACCIMFLWLYKANVNYVFFSSTEKMIIGKFENSITERKQNYEIVLLYWLHSCNIIRLKIYSLKFSWEAITDEEEEEELECLFSSLFEEFQSIWYRNVFVNAHKARIIDVQRRRRWEFNNLKLYYKIQTKDSLSSAYFICEWRNYCRTKNTIRLAVENCNFAYT